MDRERVRDHEDPERGDRADESEKQQSATSPPASDKSEHAMSHCVFPLQTIARTTDQQIDEGRVAGAKFCVRAPAESIPP
ncbi:MAG: hypothetical protein E6G34_03860 [Actinobacteria bacterium]|nr:MAG: hypothetical protein E6G34_03860 [Actinomycetota bacterium]